MEGSIPSIPQSVGRRIQELRQALGWTQQQVADRIAISRVAVSHIESDLTIPGERTITLLAGLFKLDPHDLVEGTTYPMAKAERLPLVTNCFTALELDLAVLKNDLAWLESLETSREAARFRASVSEKWGRKLAEWDRRVIDPQARAWLEIAWKQLRSHNQG